MENLSNDLTFIIAKLLLDSEFNIAMVNKTFREHACRYLCEDQGKRLAILFDGLRIKCHIRDERKVKYLIRLKYNSSDAFRSTSLERRVQRFPWVHALRGPFIGLGFVLIVCKFSRSFTRI